MNSIFSLSKSTRLFTKTPSVANHSLGKYSSRNFTKFSPSQQMTAPNPLPNYVYKILANTSVYQGTPIPVPSSWEFPRTEVDARDGFIHISTAQQLPGTLSRFFTDDETVQLLKIDYPRLSGFKIVRWEKASNGDSFPHLYANLEGEFVRDLKLVARGEGWDYAVKKLVQDGWLEE